VKEYAESAKDALSIQWQEELSSQIEEAKKDENFIKKLEEKWYKKEDIQSGKYNDTLTWYILAEKGAEFVAKGYIQDLEKFQSAVKNITDILGIPRPLPKIDDIPIAKWPRRDRIISEWTKLVESGKYHENGITYNPETGRIRFEPKNPTASAAEIDTSRIPPRLEYVRNW
jgi:hypothetical protein